MKRGFTLIELLVVVMIIGILAAIALPQYTAAVNKSRYSGLMPLAKSVKNAEEVAFMSDGQYIATLNDLTVNLPGDVNQDGQAGAKVSLGGGSEGNPNYVKATDTRINNNYVMYFDKSSIYPKEIHCEAKDGDKVAQQICLSSVSDGTLTATATESGYTAYVIEGEGGSSGGGSTTVSFWEDTQIPLTVFEKMSFFGGDSEEQLASDFMGINEDGHYEVGSSSGSIYYDPDSHVLWGSNFPDKFYYDNSGNLLYHTDYGSDDSKSYYDSSDELVWRAQRVNMGYDPDAGEDVYAWTCTFGTCPDNYTSLHN